jgi:hypothetical protein
MSLDLGDAELREGSKFNIRIRRFYIWLLAIGYKLYETDLAK